MRIHISSTRKNVNPFPKCSLLAIAGKLFSGSMEHKFHTTLAFASPEGAKGTSGTSGTRVETETATGTVQIGTGPETATGTETATTHATTLVLGGIGIIALEEETSRKGEWRKELSVCVC